MTLHLLWKVPQGRGISSGSCLPSEERRGQEARSGSISHSPHPEHVLCLQQSTGWRRAAPRQALGTDEGRGLGPGMSMGVRECLVN